MPAGLAEIYEARKLAAARRGWATSPHHPCKTERLAWMDYWAALEERAEREGWFAPPVKAT